MVNKNNNKNTNVINIINDLKGLGLLKSKRKRRRQSSEQVGKVIINPNRQLTGIEKVVIDNSPMLRRDVERIVQEKSLLDDKVMENENRLRFMFDELDSGRAFNRFINENQNMGSSQGLANVQSNSLNLPSMTQLYDEDQKLKTDSIDVPIVDASSAMKRADEEQAPIKEEQPTVVEINSQPAGKIQAPIVADNKPSDIEPDISLRDIYKQNDEVIYETPKKNKKQRSTSPSPLDPQFLLSPVSKIRSKIADKTTEKKELFHEFATSKLESMKNPKDQKLKAQTEETLKKKDKTFKEIQRLYEDLHAAEERKFDEKKRILELNKKRKEQQQEIDKLKTQQLPSMEALAKEKKIQDDQTDLLTEKYFKSLGGKEYVTKNYENDLNDIYKFSNTNNKILSMKTNKELTEKYMKYLNLSGLQTSGTIAGKGYSNTHIISNLEKIKQGIRKRFHIYDPSTRAPSRTGSTIRTMRDLEKTVDTNAKASSSNMKADKII